MIIPTHNRNMQLYIIFENNRSNSVGIQSM